MDRGMSRKEEIDATLSQLESVILALLDFGYSRSDINDTIYAFITRVEEEKKQKEATDRLISGFNDFIAIRYGAEVAESVDFSNWVNTIAGKIDQGLRESKIIGDSSIAGSEEPKSVVFLD